MVNYGTRKEPLSSPIPLRLSHHIRRQSKRLSTSTGLDLADVLRLSIARGLPIVERQLGLRRKNGGET